MAGFTKQAMKASFLKLLSERPVDRITVKDIVRDCGVNRNSFYYHFTDLPAMIEEILTERADEILSGSGSDASLADSLRALTRFALGNKRAILHLYRSPNRELVERYVVHICRHLVERYLETVGAAAVLSEEDRGMLVQFLQCECIGQVILWLGGGLTDDGEARFDRQCQVLADMTEELVRRYVSAAGSEEPDRAVGGVDIS